MLVTGAEDIHGSFVRAAAAGAVRRAPGYVLSRPFPISAAIGLGLAALWLGLASYAAIVKHPETVAQGRELARLESTSKGCARSSRGPTGRP
jgi:hypothetical protein